MSVLLESPDCCPACPVRRAECNRTERCFRQRVISPPPAVAAERPPLGPPRPRGRSLRALSSAPVTEGVTAGVPGSSLCAGCFLIELTTKFVRDCSASIDCRNEHSELESSRFAHWLSSSSPPPSSPDRLTRRRAVGLMVGWSLLASCRPRGPPLCIVSGEDGRGEENELDPRRPHAFCARSHIGRSADGNRAPRRRDVHAGCRRRARGSALPQPARRGLAAHAGVLRDEAGRGRGGAAELGRDLAAGADGGGGQRGRGGWGVARDQLRRGRRREGDAPAPPRSSSSGRLLERLLPVGRRLRGVARAPARRAGEDAAAAHVRRHLRRAEPAHQRAGRAAAQERGVRHRRRVRAERADRAGQQQRGAAWWWWWWWCCCCYPCCCC